MPKRHKKPKGIAPDDIFTRASPFLRVLIHRLKNEPRDVINNGATVRRDVLEVLDS